MALQEITAEQAAQIDPVAVARQAALQQAPASLQSTQLGNQVSQQNVQQQNVNTQQIQAPQALGADLKNGMTLGDVLKKYLPLKIDAHEIYKQYLSGNTFGQNGKPKTPIESPEELINMGVPADALGKVGETGTVQDRWNTGSAIEELRIAKELFNKTNAEGIAGNKLGVDSNSAAYQAAMTILGNHLSSLIPGASGAQATGQSLLNTLPNSKNITSYAPDVANAQFDTVEKMLLAQKKYSYDDVYSTPPTTTQPSQTKAPKTGGEILSTILGNAGKEISNTVNPFEAIKIKASDSEQQKQEKLKQLTNMLVDQSQSSQPGNIIKNTLEQYLGIYQDPKKAFTEKPISTTLAVLAPLLGIKGAMGKSAGVEAGAESTVALPKIPGGLSTKINPSKTMAAGGQFKDIAVKTIDKNGIPIKGDEVLPKIQAEFSSLRDAFSGGVVKKDYNMAISDLESQFTGKNFTADQLKSIYDKIPSGYTKTGIQKEDFASQLNIIKRDAISQVLDTKSGGLWQKGVDAQSKSYRGKESQTNKTIKNLPAKAVGVGLNIGGLGVLAKMLGI